MADKTESLILLEREDTSVESNSTGSGSIIPSLRDVTGYFSSVIPWLPSNSEQLEIEEWDTKMIDGSLVNRLNSADKYLQRLKTTRDKVQAQYDKTATETKNIRAQYDNNLECINNKIQEIRNDVMKFQENIASLVLANTGTEADKFNEQTLEAVRKIFDFTEKLKYKIGNNGDGIFKHIDTLGVQNTTDYYRAMELNKRILDKVAENKEMERPLEKKLIEIDAASSKVTREIQLIKDFKVAHTKIITENNGPVVYGKPKQMLLADNDADAATGSQ